MPFLLPYGNGTTEIRRLAKVPVPALTLYFILKVVEPAVRPVTKKKELPVCVLNTASMTRMNKAKGSPAATVLALK